MRRNQGMDRHNLFPDTDYQAGEREDGFAYNMTRIAKMFISEELSEVLLA